MSYYHHFGATEAFITLRCARAGNHGVRGGVVVRGGKRNVR